MLNHRTDGRSSVGMDLHKHKRLAFVAISDTKRRGQEAKARESADPKPPIERLTLLRGRMCRRRAVLR
ncbi:hypothetical protein FHX34_107200 [Actinoplanes teichomyceticus]|uniref:Uncharacterized protein n=1 Tax=Actinoplanes teichomyceticus TaxID=1867 RepID=A0A561VGK0_ACTTI|nr:hypothetical protein FHX34_107200 [Actinoplanes teichomyceticus]